MAVQSLCSDREEDEEVSSTGDLATPEKTWPHTFDVEEGVTFHTHFCDLLCVCQ